jgi:hypothetical protein
LIHCTKCGEIVDYEAKFCSRCGTVRDTTPPQRSGCLSTIILSVLGVSLSLGVLYLIVRLIHWMWDTPLPIN